MVFIVDYVASALLKVNTTTDSQEVIRIFENASAGAQRVRIILLAVSKHETPAIPLELGSGLLTQESPGSRH
jgi:hypothetical protein